jgi:Mn-dependent DtxR family transcriptional regulator
MVLVATSIFAGAMILSPSEGVLFRMLRRHQIKLHIASEDVLKAVYRLAEARVACTVGAIVNRVELSLTSVNVALKTLTNEACVEMHSREVRLTPDGKQRAIGLVRAHRLWESYLVEEAGIGLDAIHTEAERLEHAHHLAEEIDKKLGHPQRDPHGTIIPTN